MISTQHSLIRQSKRYNFVGRLTAKVPSPTRGDHDKLFSALSSHIRNRRSVPAGRQLCYPSCFPVRESKARKRLSAVAPINISPLAVATEPPRFGEPVSPFTPSTTPSGTFQTISPLLTSTAFKVPQGGFWQGHWFSSQNRAYSPPLELRRYATGAPAGCASIAPTDPNSFTFTKKYPNSGSNDPPDHVAPPNVPGTTSVCLLP